MIHGLVKFCLLSLGVHVATGENPSVRRAATPGRAASPRSPALCWLPEKSYYLPLSYWCSRGWLRLAAGPARKTDHVTNCVFHGSAWLSTPRRGSPASARSSPWSGARPRPTDAGPSGLGAIVRVQVDRLLKASNQPAANRGPALALAIVGNHSVSNQMADQRRVEFDSAPASGDGRGGDLRAPKESESVQHARETGLGTPTTGPATCGCAAIACSASGSRSASAATASQEWLEHVSRSKTFRMIPRSCFPASARQLPAAAAAQPIQPRARHVRCWPRLG
jgi:hypothetical protein